MSKGPETIWAFYTPDDFDDGATITAYEQVQHGGAEYRRADLVAQARIEELETKLAKAVEALEFIVTL